MASAITLLGCALGGLLVAACSPFGGGAFECTQNTQCGAGGTCSGGFCSFPDMDCESGLRYGEASGPSSNQCVSAATPDASITQIDAPVETGICYGSGLAKPCFASAPTGTKVLDADINTDTDALCDADPRNSAWCVIAGASIEVPNTVVVSGGKPLVLVATTTISVAGELDASSTRAGKRGPGSNATTCSAGTAPGTSGGGAGGSFAIKGGDGGGGMNQASSAGVAGNTITPTALHGGCRGQDGNGTNKGAGGNGGGALYLIADTSITIEGLVNAGGAGGSGATGAQSGGGGGGAGGFIGLDSPTVTNNGALTANGGGGGEGSGNTSTGNGGDDVTAASAASGGSLGSFGGGDGGDGAADGDATGQSGSNASGGGGGGGGGYGIIRLDRANTLGGTGEISPTPT